MKKLFTLTLGLALTVSLISCGGSGNNTNEAQSAAISAAVAPILGAGIQSAVDFDLDDDSINVNESGTITIPQTNCGDTGTMTGTMTYDVDAEAQSGTITIDQTLTNCDGTDDYCSLPYIINGTMSVNVSGSTTSANMGINASLTVTGLSTSTLSCVIDLSVNGVNLETATEEEILAAIQGTICGKTPAELDALIAQAESNPTEYCTALLNLPEEDEE
jgi:hypothetical protein